MSASPDHGNLDITLQGVHVPYQWAYADAAARAAATGFATADVGKLALQADDSTLWLLTAITPTWVQTGGSGGAPGGPAGGDLAGTYPNPTLAALTVDTAELVDASVTDAKLAGSISDGKLATSYIKADGSRAFTGDQSLGAHKLTSVADPASAQDAVTKAYGDANYLTSGGAPTGAAGGDLSGTYPNPSVVDDSHAHTNGTLTVAHSSTTGQTANDHHAQLHKSAHVVGGGDALASTDEINLQAIQSHVRVGATGAPATSAALDVVSTDGAILIPRMTTTQRNALTATAGMIIYNTSTGSFQRYDGSWADFGTSGVSPLTVKEIDGTPSVAGVTILQFTNGTLTDNGGGNVTVTIAAGSSYNDPAEGLAMALSL